MTHLATVFATLATLLAASATSAPVTAPRAPAPPSPSCSVNVISFGPGGSGTSHTVTVGTPPSSQSMPWGLDGVLLRDTVAVGPLSVRQTGAMYAYDNYSVATATRAGRLYRHYRSSGVNFAYGEDSGWSAKMAVRGLPPVRAIARGGESTLYTLDGGTLRRFVDVPNADAMRGGGKATGYSTYRGLTVMRIEKDRDILLATTTRGALMRIEVPRTRAFTPRPQPLRTKTWQLYDRLVARRCGTATILVGVNTRTGHAQAYTIGAARTPASSTSIRRWGALPQPITGPFVVRSTYIRADDVGPDDEW